MRHVGLAESISMIADALGWKLDRITDEIQPKIATETVASEFLAVDAGFVCGIVQDGVGYRDGVPVITLHMEAYLGAPESFDAVEITGSPALKMKIAGGVHGDIATASIVGEFAAPRSSTWRRGCTPCGTCRCRRFSAGGRRERPGSSEGPEGETIDGTSCQTAPRGSAQLRESFAEANQRLVATAARRERRRGGAAAGRRAGPLRRSAGMSRR